MKRSWTQAVCTACWNERNPDRLAHVRVNAQYAEKCCHCGVRTFSGIFVRVDPSTVPFPTYYEED